MERKKQPTWLFWLIVLSLLAVVCSMNGISLVPPQQYQKLSLNPFISRTDIAGDNYWQETVLLPIIAFYTRQNTPLAFSVLCLLILLAAYSLFAQLSYVRFGFRAAIVFTAILLAGPLSTILLSWLGTPDGLTFLLTIPFLFSSSTGLIFIFSLLGVTNHVVFLLAAFEILALRWAAKDRISYIQIFAQLSGGFVGYLMVQYFIYANHIHIMSRFDFILSRNFTSWLQLNSMNTAPTIFSFFHIQWLLIIACTAVFFRKDRLFFSIAWGLLLINYCITFFTLDQTRIFSLLSWGIILLCIFRSYLLLLESMKHDTGQNRAFLDRLAFASALSLILPRYYSWEGNVYLSPFWAHLMNMIK